MKAVYDNSPGESGTAYSDGKITMSSFLIPLNTCEVRISIIIMDRVRKQDNSYFVSILDNMRNGTMNVADSNFIASQCLDNMTAVERNTIREEIIVYWNGKNSWYSIQISDGRICKSNSQDN